MRPSVWACPSVADAGCGCGRVRGGGRPARRGGVRLRCARAGRPYDGEVRPRGAGGWAIVRRQPVRACAAGPAGAVAWADRKRPELVEGETAVRESAGHLLDPIQLGVLVRIFGLLPSPRALEGDSVRAQDLPQPF